MDDLDGIYDLVDNRPAEEKTQCMDDCVYKRKGELKEYCFKAVVLPPSSKVYCSALTTLTHGSYTTTTAAFNPGITAPIAETSKTRDANTITTPTSTITK